MTWIETLGHRRFDFRDPSEAMVDAQDIVGALRNINRFTGHTRPAYSVLEHSLHVADMAEALAEDSGFGAAELNLCWVLGLLHDAHEAYVGDLAGPAKALCPDYQALEHRVQRVVLRRFGLPDPLFSAGAQERLPEVPARHPLHGFPPSRVSDVWSVVHHADMVLLALEAELFFPEPARPAPWRLPNLPTTPSAAETVRVVRARLRRVEPHDSEGDAAPTMQGLLADLEVLMDSHRASARG